MRFQRFERHAAGMWPEPELLNESDMPNLTPPVPDPEDAPH